MRKSFYLLFIFFIYSCTTNLDLRDESDIENIKLENTDIIIDSDESDLIDGTTDEDIDELIDILFETNNN